MSDPAAQIAREAKSLHQGLKESLKTRDVADREVDIQRKNLRRQYLRLLFVHPYARESKDAENHLWMQTSYSLISIYKQRITALDRAIHQPPRHNAQQPQQQPSRAVEYRRLLQRFRQFLSEEEKFWTQLVLRFRRHFAIDESQPALTALGIVPEEESVPSADGTGRRNQFQFPPESEQGSAVASAVIPTNQAQRESRVAIISKALVCLGDIARYKELYNEAGGRPRAGHEDGPPAAASTTRNGRSRRGGGPAQASGMVALPRLRNYDRAQSCYEQARLLLPFDGNPSHQLAILSSYQKDIFGSLVHYYRALCVRTPYETASENLGTVLNKALEQYKAKGLVRDQEKQAEIASGAPAVPRLRVEAFKEKVVVLHSMWSMNIDEAHTLGEKVITDFAGLVADRILPIDMISKVIILLQGALWKHRMLRRPAGGEKRSTRPSTAESQIVTHLIATHRVLLHNGSVELTDSPPEDAAEYDLAQRITATFRRTLPALRMAGKWLRSNTRYISQARKVISNNEDEASALKDTSKGKDKRNGNSSPIIIGGIQEFWTEYVRFCATLIHAFPVEQLPELRTQLEEDIELAGFLPLRKYMYGSDGKPPGSRRASTEPHGEGRTEPRVSQDRPTSRAQVHPNEEQLMRIADILLDAKAVASDENTPIVFTGSSFEAEDARPSGTSHSASMVEDRGSILNNAHPIIPSHEASVYGATQSEADEDDTTSLTTKTDDDYVREVFDRVIDGSDVLDDEEEQIVWQPSSRISPQQDMAFSSLPMTPPTMSPRGTGGSLNPHRSDQLSPIFRQMELERATVNPSTVPTTADDLLKNMMGSTRSPRGTQHARGSSLPPVSLLLTGNSIWSTTTDVSTMQYPKNNAQLGNSMSYVPPAPPFSPQNTLVSPPIWQSGLPPTNTLVGYSNGSSLNTPAQNPSLHGMHQRIPSQSHVPFQPNTALPLSQQRHSAHLSSVLNGSAAMNEPIEFAGSSLSTRLPPVGYAGVYPSARASSEHYRPQQTDHYDIGASAHRLRREQAFHSPFPPSSISNIWGNPG